MLVYPMVTFGAVCLAFRCFMSVDVQKDFHISMSTIQREHFLVFRTAKRLMKSV